MIWINVGRCPIWRLEPMAKPFIFKCPKFGLNVQGYDDEDEPERTERRRYKMCECLACGGFHLVDPDTGELISDRR